MRTILLIGLALLVGVGVGWQLLGGGEPELAGMTRDPAPTVEGLLFTDHADPAGPRETDLRAEPGGLTLVYFGYLSCPDVCPATMVDIVRAQDAVGVELAARTSVAFVTVDPERDDPERLRSYLEHFFDTPFRALTASDEDALESAAAQLGVSYEVEPHEPGAERYDVAHSAVTYVVDDRGVVVRELPFGVTADEIAAVLRAYL
jgi:protein SCO1